MSDIFTRIGLPGVRNVGLLEHDRCSAEQMITNLRKWADYMRAQTAAIDGAADEDFQIDIIRGSIVQHHVAEVQKARSKS